MCNNSLQDCLFTEVMKPYLPLKPQCLELFARYMLPHWTSVGDQVLTLQNKKLFTQIQKTEIYSVSILIYETWILVWALAYFSFQSVPWAYSGFLCAKIYTEFKILTGFSFKHREVKNNDFQKGVNSAGVTNGGTEENE